MMIIKKICLAAVITSSIVSCKKEHKETTLVNATVRNAVTGMPISTEIRVQIFDNREIEKWLGYEEESHIVDDQIVTNGAYSFSFNALKDKGKTSHHYSVIAGKEDVNYYFSPANVKESSSPIELNATNNIELKLHPLSSVSYKFFNLDCATATSFKLFSNHLELPDYFNDTSWDFNGCTDYNQGHYSSIPIGDVHFEWHVTRNSVTEIFHDTLNFNSGDSLLLDINY